MCRSTVTLVRRSKARARLLTALGQSEVVEGLGPKLLGDPADFVEVGADRLLRLVERHSL
jgi:hypothetical protein